VICQPRENLTSEEVEAHLHLVIKDAVSTQAMLSLTSGIFLVALAIQLGASNTTIGLLSAIPFLVQLIQLPAIYLVEKLRNRKMITALFCFVARFFWLGIASIPFFFSGESAVFFLVFFFVFLIGLYSIHRLTSIREEGEVEESVVIQEFFMEIRRELGITSTVGGLRGIVFYPLHVFKKISSKRFSVFDDTPEP